MLDLVAHPTTPCSAVESLQCRCAFLDNGKLSLRYLLQGDLDQFCVPSLKSPEAVDGLWEQTCFEVFICVQGETGYYEYNFSPSTQWAAYAFRDYRERKTWTASAMPTITVEQRHQKLLVDVLLDYADLPLSLDSKQLRLGLTAVLESVDGSKSYWALEHPADTPDFHHKNGFTHEVWP